MLGNYIISEHGCNSWYEHSIHRQEDRQAKSTRKKSENSESSHWDFKFFFLFSVAPITLGNVNSEITWDNLRCLWITATISHKLINMVLSWRMSSSTLHDL